MCESNLAYSNSVCERQSHIPRNIYWLKFMECHGLPRGFSGQPNTHQNPYPYTRVWVFIAMGHGLGITHGYQNLLMRSHYLWPWKLQNCTIAVNLEAIQTITIASKLFWPLYLGYNRALHYTIYGLWLSRTASNDLGLQSQHVPSISLVPSDSL